jgi:hypothetical protein
MTLAETTVQNHIRHLSGQFGDYLWRNNTGVLPDLEGRPVRYGLCNDSPALNKALKSSDLIGATRVLITPEMVGQVLAVFTAVEVKEEGWKFRPSNPREVAQNAFINLVLNSGGFAGFAQSVEDYRRIVRK